MSATVTATPGADQLIDRLMAEHGPLSFHYSGRIGHALLCLRQGELRLGSLDVEVGRLRDMPVFMLPEDAANWKGRRMLISLVEGFTRGFSLEEGSGQRFVLLPV
jgi:uncharacterized protein